MSEVLDALRVVVGDRYAGNHEPDAESTPIFHGETFTPATGSILVKPASTEQVSQVVRIAADHGWPVVPVGGRTGTVGGAEPLTPSILLSLNRLDKISEVDPVNMTVTAGAGVILQTLQERVEAEGLVYPVDIGARGSATVGGIVSTNAGGLRAIRWGVTRDTVLGLEVVLADGTIIDGLRKLLKNNAGYDWMQPVIGSEGTLAIVTQAVLRLRRRTAPPITALLACRDFPAALTLLRTLEIATSDGVTTFELMWGDTYDFIATSASWPHRASLAPGFPFYALVEIEGGPEHMAALETAFAEMGEKGLVMDGVVAQSKREQDGIWAIREDMRPLAGLGPILSYDVSVPIDAQDVLARSVASDMGDRLPHAQLLTFGHAGDGNLHFVVAPGVGREGDGAVIDDIIYTQTGALRGSVSAEHGIGLYRRTALRYCRSAQERALMRRMKAAFDPHDRLNPGKIFSQENE